MSAYGGGCGGGCGGAYGGAYGVHMVLHMVQCFKHLTIAALSILAALDKPGKE